MALQPWGPVALTASYVVTIGYVVYLGGDYANWLQTGTSEHLNFVPGVRTVVRQELGAA